MRQFILPLVLVFTLASCQDDSEKAATELCDCLSGKFKKPSKDFKKLMKKIAESEVPSVAYKKEFAKLDEETRTTLQEEINKLIEIDEQAVSSCTKKIADYKIKGKDEEERAKKVVEIMAGKDGCEVASGQWAMAVEQTYKNGGKKDDDAANEETDEPKKKKPTTEEE